MFHGIVSSLFMVKAISKLMPFTPTGLLEGVEGDLRIGHRLAPVSGRFFFGWNS